MINRHERERTMKRYKTALLTIVCCAFVGVFLAGCGSKQDQDIVNKPGKGLTEEQRKSKRGEE